MINFTHESGKCSWWRTEVQNCSTRPSSVSHRTFQTSNIFHSSQINSNCKVFRSLRPSETFLECRSPKCLENPASCSNLSVIGLFSVKIQQFKDSWNSSSLWPCRVTQGIQYDHPTTHILVLMVQTTISYTTKLARRTSSKRNGNMLVSGMSRNARSSTLVSQRNYVFVVE